jgi:hypothetical protein
MTPNIKETIAQNVIALLGNQEKGATAALVGMGISNGTATRILHAKVDLGVDMLVKLAAGLKVQPWQLCVPGLDPSRMPSLEPLPFRWPFRQIDPEVLTGLTGTPAQQVENGMLATLAAVGVNPRKPQARRA